jgi:hypothetical protein
MSAKIVTSYATEQPQLINGFAELPPLNKDPLISSEMKSENRIPVADLYENTLAQIAQIFAE